MKFLGIFNAIELVRRIDGPGQNGTSGDRSISCAPIKRSNKRKRRKMSPIIRDLSHLSGASSSKVNKDSSRAV